MDSNIGVLITLYSIKNVFWKMLRVKVLTIADMINIYLDMIMYYQLNL